MRWWLAVVVGGDSSGRGYVPCGSVGRDVAGGSWSFGGQLPGCAVVAVGGWWWQLAVVTAVTAVEMLAAVVHLGSCIVVLAFFGTEDYKACSYRAVCCKGPAACPGAVLRASVHHSVASNGTCAGGMHGRDTGLHTMTRVSCI